MKTRLDIALTELNFARSRTAAQRIINEGAVLVNGNKIVKSSERVDTETDIIIISSDPECMKYVGRGGFKLEKAIEHFRIKLEDKICLDIGASTGGFTDCMLQHGAKKVFSVDVGKDQLDLSLKRNPKVISLEQLDIRNAKEEITEPVDFISIDVSFISLKLILPELNRFTSKESECVALIKPQFEGGKQNVGKKGVIRNPKIHQKIVEDLTGFTESIGYKVIDVIPSPIEGGDGNKEFLMYFRIT